MTKYGKYYSHLITLEDYHHSNKHQKLVDEIGNDYSWEVSPCLLVMGGVTCSEGCGFESQHHILDGHFSHIFLLKYVMFV